MRRRIVVKLALSSVFLRLGCEILYNVGHLFIPIVSIAEQLERWVGEGRLEVRWNCTAQSAICFVPKKTSQRPYFPMPEMPAYSGVIIRSVALINNLVSPSRCTTVTGPRGIFYLSHLASGYRRWSLSWRFWQRDNTLERLSNKPQRRRTAPHCLFFPHARARTQTSTCQFLYAYHLIKASPCSFSSRENCIPHHLQGSPIR